MKWSFEVGNEEKHAIEMECSLLGKETYCVDGKEVLTLRSAAMRAERKFSVGENEKHEVAIVVDMMPSWKSWLFPTDWKAQVFVDGELYIDDLTPETRKAAKTVDSAMNWVLLICVIVIAACYLFVKILGG